MPFLLAKLKTTGLLLVFGAVLLALAACGPDSTPTVAPTPGPTATPTAIAIAPAPGPRSVIVHLFEWKWSDIAQECENFLGPMGYGGVQISPPQEDVVVDGYPWWERYQPVSYKLDSRSGTRAELADMVKRCKAVGVNIYADAVINHMSGIDSGTGLDGTAFTHYNYPGLYTTDDFHHCGLEPNDDIVSYQSQIEVQTCELSNLADLNTSSPSVQDKLAAYLNDLLSLGVAGFRIDAAKHINTDELHAILAKMNKTTDGAAPFVYQEVIEAVNEPIKAKDYLQNGSVTEFKYDSLIAPVFRAGSISDLSSFGSASVFLPSASAIVFLDNHDTQRANDGSLTYKDGKLYDLANVYMLAWPYGTPSVMSSYDFSNRDQGPPSDANGKTLSVWNNGVPDCGNGRWVCEHRNQYTAGMVGFRNYTSSVTDVSNWWSDNQNVIAFGRGDKGFVIINRESNDLAGAAFQTGMAAGTYCNVTQGALKADKSGCTGPTVTVDAAGKITTTVPTMSAIAIDGAAKVGQ